MKLSKNKATTTKTQGMSLTVERYSEKSYVVRGNTRDHKDLLKENKLRYNSALNGGPGWIFPSSRLDVVWEAIKDKVEGEIIETKPRVSRSFTFDRLPVGTKFLGDEEEFTMLEMSDDCELILDDENKDSHTAHFIPSLQKWIIASEDRTCIIELKK